MLTDETMRSILHYVDTLVITPDEWVRIADEQGVQSASRLFLYLSSRNRSGARLRRSKRVQRKLLEWLNQHGPNPFVLLAFCNVRCRDAIPRLIQLLKEVSDNIIADDVIKCLLANALAHQKASDAVPLLIETAKNSLNHPEVRECCARAAGEIGCASSIQQLIDLFHEAADWRIRWGVAQGLRHRFPDKAIALLEMLTADPMLPHDLRRVGRRWIRQIQKRLSRNAISPQVYTLGV